MKVFALKIPDTVPEETFDRLLHHLPLAAQARVRKFRHESDAIRSLAGRLLPTWYLREAGIVRAPAHPVFKNHPRGKPYLSEPEVQPRVEFNTSHEGAYVLLAVVRGGEKLDVGVDVMDLPENPDELEESIGYQLTTPERLALLGAPPRIKAKLLTTLWTIKEGYTKATGDGISFGLHRIAVDLGDGRVRSVRVDQRDIREDGWRWCVGSLEGGAYGYAVIWRGDAETEQAAGGGVGGGDTMEAKVETVTWDAFVRSFIGSTSVW